MTQSPFANSPFGSPFGTQTAPPPATVPQGPGPQATPYVQPQSAPAPTSAPTSAPPAASYGDDPFGAPAPRADRPRIMDLNNRLLLITPKRFEEHIASSFKNPDGTPQFQDRMTCDVVVLDGGPLQFGGQPEDGVPHSKQAAVPMLIEAMYISNKGLTSQLREAYRARLSGSGKGMVLGRLHKGPKGNQGKPPWLLTTTPTEEEKQLARAYLAANPADPFGAATQGS